MDTPNVIINTDALLDAGFRQIYEEVELARKHAPETDDTRTAEQAAQQLHHHLRNLIDLHDQQARRAFSRTDATLLEQARYLKAALADELLLNRPWAGQTVWAQNLLEAALFHSSIAGDKILDQIERLLSEREPTQRSLARLYLFALALGFQGRWHGQPEIAKLPDLRRELYQFVYQRQPEGGDLSRKLSPEAYASTLAHLAPKRRRTLSRWVVAWLISMVTLLALSELLWLWPTWSLRQVLSVTPSIRMEMTR
jgi:type VI secretion system protein ImpK